MLHVIYKILLDASEFDVMQAKTICTRTVPFELVSDSSSDKRLFAPDNVPDSLRLRIDAEYQRFFTSFSLE